MTVNATSYEFHSTSKRVRYVLSYLFVVACIWVAFNARTATMAWIAVAFGFCALAVHLDQRVRIDMTLGTVHREQSFLGCRLRPSQWLLSNFTGIITHRIPGRAGMGLDMIQVALKHSDRTTLGVTHSSNLIIRYFNTGRGQPCPEADTFAGTLGEITHLKLHKVA